MKTLLAGGVNGSLNPGDEGYDEFGNGNNYFVRQIIGNIKKYDPSKIAIVSAAKENKHFFDKQLSDCGIDVEAATILNKGDVPDWASYEVVILMGGNTRRLYDWLQETDFSLKSLASCKLLVGESAGAYVLGAEVLIDYTAGGEGMEIIDGFNPASNMLIAAHVNNIYYHTERLDRRLQSYCELQGVEYVPLRENELYELIKPTA